MNQSTMIYLTITQVQSFQSVEPRTKLRTRICLHQFCLTHLSLYSEQSHTKLMQKKPRTKLCTRLYRLELKTRKALDPSSQVSIRNVLVSSFKTDQRCLRNSKRWTEYHFFKLSSCTVSSLLQHQRKLPFVCLNLA